jgi:hypothetical protein
MKDIQNNDVEGGGFGQAQGRSAIMRHNDAEGPLFQIAPNILGYFTVIIHKQNAHLS